jgi:DNA-binding NtrC family response regulator
MARRLLLVDDERDITDAIKSGLQLRGFVVETYNNPREVLANIRPDRYDLAIFDIRMPKMSGFELYREFRKLDGHTPVCFFTAFEVYMSEFEKVFRDVPVALLKKNMSIGQLAKQLDEIIEGHESVSRRPVVARR